MVMFFRSNLSNLKNFTFKDNKQLNGKEINFNFIKLK